MIVLLIFVLSIEIARQSIFLTDIYYDNLYSMDKGGRVNRCSICQRTTCQGFENITLFYTIMK